MIVLCALQYSFANIFREFVICKFVWHCKQSQEHVCVCDICAKRLQNVLFLATANSLINRFFIASISVENVTMMGFVIVHRHAVNR